MPKKNKKKLLFKRYIQCHTNSVAHFGEKYMTVTCLKNNVIKICCVHVI